MNFGTEIDGTLQIFFFSNYEGAKGVGVWICAVCSNRVAPFIWDFNITIELWVLRCNINNFGQNPPLYGGRSTSSSGLQYNNDITPLPTGGAINERVNPAPLA